MRIVIAMSAMVIAGCAVTLPAGDAFTTAMLERRAGEEALLFVYSMPTNQEAYYKYILVDGIHRSTITNETFARLAVPPGTRTVRISQHGWKGRVEMPNIFGVLEAPDIMALTDVKKDVEIAPDGIHFVAIDMKERTIVYECGETKTATQVCRKEVKGVVIEEPSRETALSILSSLHEVCEACE